MVGEAWNLLVGGRLLGDDRYRVVIAVGALQLILLTPTSQIKRQCEEHMCERKLK